MIVTVLSAIGVATLIHATNAAAVVQSSDRPPEEIVGALLMQDAAVARIGSVLVSANAAFCAGQRDVPGMVVQRLDQYAPRFRAAALSRFARPALPSIVALVPGSVAANAGLRTGDVLVAVNGVSVPALPDPHGNARFEPTAAVLDRIDAAIATGRLTIDIMRNGSTATVAAVPIPACRARFQVMPQRAMKASADGLYVQITDSLVEFAVGDGELASVLAHELGHNILRHAARNVRRSRATTLASEIEADRLSPYLMAAAGYDPRDALRYWHRHGAERGDRIFRKGTHPRWRDRVKLIGIEVDRIAALQKAGAPITLPADLRAVLP